MTEERTSGDDLCAGAIFSVFDFKNLLALYEVGIVSNFLQVLMNKVTDSALLYYYSFEICSLRHEPQIGTRFSCRHMNQSAVECKTQATPYTTAFPLFEQKRDRS